MEQARWRILVERYAIRARAFSDAVALLGRATLSPTECRQQLEEIRMHHESCVAAAEEVEEYIHRKAAAADEE
jgi:hypothetical protein